MGETGITATHARSLRYRTTLDRAGLALAAGGSLYGLATVLLALGSGGRDAGMLVELFAVGTVLAMLAITATFGPLWLALHASGRRGPGHAAVLGGVVALALWATAAEDALRSYAFATTGVAAIGWLRAIGVALIFTAIAAAIALVMWRVAYRRTG